MEVFDMVKRRFVVLLTTFIFLISTAVVYANSIEGDNKGDAISLLLYALIVIAILIVTVVLIFKYHKKNDVHNKEKISDDDRSKK